MHPETRNGGSRRGSSRQTGDLNDRFTSDTAAKTGKPERSIQRDATRAKALGADLDRIAETSLDKGAELDALAAVPRSRYFVYVFAARPFGTSFPWGVLIINVSGSALIGAFVSLLALRWSLSEPARAFLTVGICGGFTTFSTFALDSFYLFERGQMVFAALYVSASVVLSIAALVGAMLLVRSFA